MLLVLFAAPAAAFCVGDEDGDGLIDDFELRAGLERLFDRDRAGDCSTFDRDGDGRVRAADLAASVIAAAEGCAPEPPPIPTGQSELLPWLQAGNYRAWRGESGPHASAGPHFGVVRTFVNEPVFQSLCNASGPHPMGSALVKELYGQGVEVRGWSVMVKVSEDSAAGAGWYWHERFGQSVYADGTGAIICTGCHSLGDDFVRSPFPLQ